MINRTDLDIINKLLLNKKVTSQELARIRAKNWRYYYDALLDAYRKNDLNSINLDILKPSNYYSFTNSKEPNYLFLNEEVLNGDYVLFGANYNRYYYLAKKQEKETAKKHYHSANIYNYIPNDIFTSPWTLNKNVLARKEGQTFNFNVSFGDALYSVLNRIGFLLQYLGCADDISVHKEALNEFIAIANASNDALKLHQENKQLIKQTPIPVVLMNEEYDKFLNSYFARKNDDKLSISLNNKHLDPISATANLVIANNGYYLIDNKTNKKVFLQVANKSNYANFFNKMSNELLNKLITKQAYFLLEGSGFVTDSAITFILDNNLKAIIKNGQQTSISIHK